MKPVNTHLTTWSAPLVELVAFLCYNGSCNNNRYRFYINNNFNLAKQLLKKLKIRYKTYTFVNQKFFGPKKRTSIQFYSKPLCKLLAEEQISIKCRERAIPDFVLKDADYLRIWLRMMIDCRGGFSTYGYNRQPYLLRIYTTSKVEARQLQQMGFTATARINLNCFECKLYDRIKFIRLIKFIKYFRLERNNACLQDFLNYEQVNIYRPDLMLEARS